MKERITLSEFYETVERVLELDRFPNYDIKKAGLALINENWYYGVIYKPNELYEAKWIPYLSGRGVELDIAHIEPRRSFTPSQIRTLLGIGDVWDYSNFQYGRQPVPFEKVLDKYAFTTPMPNVVDLPVKMAGDDTIYLPYEYRGMKEPLSKIIDFEKQINPRYDEYYAYITIDKRKPDDLSEYGCHVDGFQSALVDPKVETSHSYVVSTEPTEFVTEGFDITDMGETVEEWNNSFQRQTEHMEKMYLEPFDIGLFDAYQVHSPVVATTEMERTLFRVTFSVRQLDYIGNGFNPLIPYEWEYKLKGDEPVEFR